MKEDDNFIMPKFYEIELLESTKRSSNNKYIIELDNNIKEVNDMIVRFTAESPQHAIKRLGKTIDTIKYLRF